MAGWLMFVPHAGQKQEDVPPPEQSPRRRPPMLNPAVMIVGGFLVLVLVVAFAALLFTNPKEEHDDIPFASATQQVQRATQTAVAWCEMSVLQEPQCSDPRQILFTAECDGDSDMYVVNADGCNLHKLVQNQDDDWYPLPSPDGTRIAFSMLGTTASGGQTDDIYVMNRDGSDLHNWTHAPTNSEGQFSWSPDGSRIVYVGYQRDAFSNIYTVSAGQSEQIFADNGTFDSMPAWSPDGKWLVYQSQQISGDPAFTNYDIFQTDGSAPRNLTATEDRSESEPSWSPDGTRIAYFADQSYFIPDAYWICVRDLTEADPLCWPSGAHGSSVQAVGAPVWSPDGTRLLFTARGRNSLDIFLLDLTAGSVRNLTRNRAYDGSPGWSPDGRWITFISRQTGSSDLFRMDADGTDMVNLTRHGADDLNYSWSPDSQSIVFVSYRSGRPALFIINADGTALHQITNPGAAGYQNPVWLP
ncbi:MAG TPA: hypothetical protein VHP83_09180 [Aggregatilineaceae bacterium]|nr:hypothetical protein [Aggregatilineaceae bacterium]